MEAFAFPWSHSPTHAIIGIIGLVVYRTFRASRAHALALGVTYAVPILFGVFVRDVCSLGDLLFIDGTGDMLHVLTSFGVFVAYLTTRLLENERGAASPRL